MAETWLNDDGLYIKFGATEAVPTKGGEILADGELHVHTIVIDFGDLLAFGNETILADNLIYPDGARMEKAEFVVESVFAGATATLDLGIIEVDRSTAVDADGIDAVIDVVDLDAVGDVIDCNGALIDTSPATGGLYTATVGTADFTAGRGILRVYYYVPHVVQ